MARATSAGGSELTTHRWKQIDAIFAGALKLSADERADYVRRACADDPELRKEVEELLEAADSADSYFEAIRPHIQMAADFETGATLDADSSGAGSSAPDESPAPRAGELVGPYRLLRPIGEGGMGTVYLAERADGQFEQRVAIKLVQASRVRGDGLIRRFLRERQILARLQHPNIARLYDGGLADHGQPYLAMEYVEGIPITEYARAHELSIDDRIRLIMEVGRAVQHAHRNLIIHRDLKPSNLLVTPDGRVKLLDFGIAKLLEDDGDATVTRTGQHVMTPAYAAPEQVTGDPVTTATDVHALGVLLYELLTGRRPFGSDRETPRHELAEAVVSEDPLPPSSVVAAASAKDAAFSGRDQRLSDDLDRICLMAMRKEPERRYPSAQAFVDDLDRYLSGHPVIARPDSFRYRAKKFISRNRLGMAAAAAVFLALAGGLGAALWQAEIAEREAATAREVRDFALGLFEVSDPDPTRSRDISARELLARGAERIDEELAGQPAVQAEMYSVIGPIFTRLGLYEDARPLLARAVEMEERVSGRRSERYAAAVHELGRLEQVAGNGERADSLHRAAMSAYEEASGTNSLGVARVLADRAALAEAGNRHVESDSLYRRARRLLAGAGAPVAEQMVIELDHAEVLHMLGEDERADSLYAYVLERRGELPTERSLTFASALAEVGRRAHYGGESERAEPLLKGALALRRDAYGDAHREIGLVLDELASVQWSLGKRVEGIATRRKAAAMLRETVGARDQGYLISLGGLGVMLNWSGDVEEAVRVFSEVEETQSDVLGEEHFHLAMTRRNLGRSLQQLGRHDKALPKLERALDGWIAAQGDGDFFTGPVRLDIARSHIALGNYGVADTLIDHVVESYGTSPPRGASVGDALLAKARLHAAQGDYERAIRSSREAIDRYEARGITLASSEGTGGADVLHRARAEAALGELLVEIGHTTEAEPHLRSAHRALVAIRGPSYPDALKVRRLLGRL